MMNKSGIVRSHPWLRANEGVDLHASRSIKFQVADSGVAIRRMMDSSWFDIRCQLDRDVGNSDDE